MRKLIIFGGSGIGMIAAAIAEDCNSHKVIGFLNDSIPAENAIGRYRKIPVLGGTEKYHEYLLDSEVDFFIAYVGLGNEEATFKKISSFEIPRCRYASLIHPTAVIPDKYTCIGKGVLFGPLSQLSPDTTIGDHCIILGNSFIGHDSELDIFAHVATNGVIGANIHVGKAVHVGSNATIREKVRIGDYSLIGSGSVVLKDVPPNAVVVGNPARVLRINK